MIRFNFLILIFATASAIAQTPDEKISVLIATNLGHPITHMIEIKSGRLSVDGVLLDPSQALNFGPNVWKIRPQAGPVLKYACAAGLVQIRSSKKAPHMSESVCLESERGQAVMGAIQNLIWLSQLN